MDLKIRSNRIVIYFSAFLMVLSAYFYMIRDYRQYQRGLLIAGVIIGILPQLVQNKDFHITVSESYKVCSWIILFTWVISGLITEDVELVVNAIALFCVYFIFCEIYSKSKITVDIFLWITCCIYLWFIIYSYLQEGIQFSSYKGLTYNSNAFGGISAGVFCFSFSYSLSECVKKCKRVCSIIICIVSFFNTIISSSRTSFLACVLVLLVGGFICRKSIITLLKKKKEVAMIVGIVLLAAMVCIIKYFNVWEIFYDAIVAKFIRKKNNPFDGRSEVWLQVWNEKSMWGNGRDYFDKIGLGAHNTFISILGQYGIMGVVSYLVLIFSSLASSVKFLKSDCDYKFVPILLSISYITMSMAEGMLMKINMLLFYFGLTIMLQYNLGCRRRKKDA